jgi:hypothetical protein
MADSVVIYESLCLLILHIYEGVTKSFQTGHLKQKLQMVQLSATRCSCIAILWVSLVSFATITLWRGQQQVIPKVSMYFVIDSVWKLLDTPSYMAVSQKQNTMGPIFIPTSKLMSPELWCHVVLQ